MNLRRGQAVLLRVRDEYWPSWFNKKPGTSLLVADVTHADGDDVELWIRDHQRTWWCHLHGDHLWRKPLYEGCRSIFVVVGAAPERDPRLGI